MSPEPPLIVTARLDPDSQAWFEDLRRSHYPAGRNRIPAHLTLFHRLPGAEESAVLTAMAAACARSPPLEAEVGGPWFLGRGVAYRLHSPPLEALRRALADVFGPWLTRQDQAAWRPHVTVQNKAEPAEARDLLQRLQFEFEPFSVGIEGLLLWRYLDGPWASVADLPFAGRPSGG